MFSKYDETRPKMPLYNFAERSSILQAESFKLITDFCVTTKKNNDAFLKDLYGGIKAAMDTEEMVLIPKTPAAPRKREKFDKENEIEEPARRPGRKASQQAQLKISNNFKFLSGNIKLRRPSVEGNVADILPIPPSGVKPPRRKRAAVQSVESSCAPLLPQLAAASLSSEPDNEAVALSNDESTSQARDSGKGASSGSVTHPTGDHSSPEPELVFVDAPNAAAKQKRASSRKASVSSVDEGFQDRPATRASSKSRPSSAELVAQNPVVKLERLDLEALQMQLALTETPPSRRSTGTRRSSASSKASSSDVEIKTQPAKRTSNRKRTLTIENPVVEPVIEVPTPILEDVNTLPAAEHALVAEEEKIHEVLKEQEAEMAPMEEEMVPQTPEPPKQPKARTRTRAVAKIVVQAETAPEEAGPAHQETTEKVEKAPEPTARATRARTKMVCKGMKTSNVILPVVEEATVVKATPTKAKPAEETKPGRKRKSEECEEGGEHFQTPAKKSPCAKGSPCKRFLKVLTPSSAKKFTPKPLFSPSRAMKVQEKVQAFEKVASPVCRANPESENGAMASTGKKPGFWKVMVQRLNVGTIEKDGRVYPNASTPVAKAVEDHVQQVEAMEEEKIAEREPIEDVVMEEEPVKKAEKKLLRESLQSLRRSGGTLNQIMAKKSLARAKRISMAKDKKISTDSGESFMSAASTNGKYKKQTPVSKIIVKQISTGQLPSTASVVKKLPSSSKSTSRLASNLVVGVTSFLPNSHAQAPKLTEAEERAKKEEEIRRRREKEEEAARKKEELMRAKAEEKKRIAEEKAQRMQAARLAKEQQMNDIQSKVASKLEKCAVAAQQLKEKRDQETLRRRQLAEAKRMEVEERRRLEEEQKKAKVREEMEEEQRKAMQKKKEMEMRQKQLQIEREKYQKAMSTFAKSNLNTTVTLDANHTSDNYDITPRGEKYMKLNSSEDYGIQDLSSGDSTDEEEEPRKKIPPWAQGAQLREAISQQNMNPPNFQQVFPPSELMKLLRLEVIFKNCRRKMRLKRTSSAVWDTPPSYKSLLQNRESL